MRLLLDECLEAAEAAGFAVLITVDREIFFQQDLRKRQLIPTAWRCLEVIQPGEALEVRD